MNGSRVPREQQKPNAVDEKNQPVDLVLKSAWELLIQYDTAALKLKQRHIRYRAIVLLLSFAASFLSVVMGLFSRPAPGRYMELVPAFMVSIPIAVAVGLVWLFHVRRNLPNTRRNPVSMTQMKGLRKLVYRVELRIRAWTEVRNRAITLVVVAVGLVAGLLIFLTSNGLAQYDTLRLSLFTLPLLSSGIMAYVTKFLPSQIWSKYRYVAEAIRREIFLYRMNAGDYFNKSAEEKRNLMLDAIGEAEKVADMPVTIFVPPIFERGKLDRLLEREAGENWHIPMTADDYIANRLINQYRWYTDKSFHEYRTMGQWEVVALAIGGAGALLAFLEYGNWVAVTTSAAVTVTGLAHLMMYGRTYVIYHQAARELRQKYDWWNAQTDDYRVKPEHISEFVATVECIFETEIGHWQEQIKDALEQAELDIGQMIESAPGGKEAREQMAKASLDDIADAEPEAVMANKPEDLVENKPATAPEDNKPAIKAVKMPAQAPAIVDITRSDQRPIEDDNDWWMNTP